MNMVPEVAKKEQVVPEMAKEIQVEQVVRKVQKGPDWKRNR